MLELKIGEIAELFGVRRSYVYQWLMTGKLASTDLDVVVEFYIDYITPKIKEDYLIDLKCEGYRKNRHLKTYLLEDALIKKLNRK